MFRRIVRVAVLGLTVSAAGMPGGAIAALAGSSAASSSCGPDWRDTSPPPADRFTFPHAVAPLSGRDVWIAGERGSPSPHPSDYRTVEHFGDSGWSRPAGTLFRGQGTFDSFDWSSARDAWLVGTRETGDFLSGFTHDSVVAHWDGATWTKLADLPQADYAYAVAEVSPQDVWVAGATGEPATYHGFTEHWDGTAWTAVPLPPTARPLVVNDMAAISSDDVWAVGLEADRSGRYNPRNRARILHWDGSAWSLWPAPALRPSQVGWSSLTAVSALGPRDVWAVGSAHGIPGRALVLRWNGQGWKRIATGRMASLTDVLAVSRQEVWTVGGDLHTWSGGSWTTIRGRGLGFLRGIAAAPGGRLWAVGDRKIDFGHGRPVAAQLCPMLVGDGGFSRPGARIGLGSSVVWRFKPDENDEHSIRDVSGLGLFRSGHRAPEAAYAFPFFASGTYPVRDPRTGSATLIRVPLMVGRSAGTDGSYPVRWATRKAPHGYGYDVQVSRNGSGFAWWRRETKAGAASFVPKGGGTYRFRARLTRIATEATSGWSPVATAVT